MKYLIKLFKEGLPELFKIAVAFLAPIIPLLFIVGGMILIDLVTGVLKARRLKEKVTSRKLGRTISKMALYQICVITCWIVEKYLLSDLIATFSSVDLLLTKIVATFFVGVELLSIDENLRQGWGINLWAKFKNLLSRVKQVKKEVGEVIELKKDS